MDIQNLKTRLQYLISNLERENSIINNPNIFDGFTNTINYINECVKLSEEMIYLFEKRYEEHADLLINNIFNEEELNLVFRGHVEHRNNLFSINVNRLFYKEILDKILSWSKSKDIHMIPEKKFEDVKNLISLYFFNKLRGYFEIDIKNHIISVKTDWDTIDIRKALDTIKERENELILYGNDELKWGLLKIKSLFNKSYKEWEREVKGNIENSKLIIRVVEELLTDNGFYWLTREFHLRKMDLVEKIKKSIEEQLNIEFFLQYEMGEK
jgi:hypothetical protein